MKTKQKLLKKFIKDDVNRGAKFLIDFAQEFAIDQRLKNYALILKLNYIRANEYSQKEVVLEKMISLVDDIVDDQLKNAQSQKAINAKIKANRLDEYSASVKLQNDVIFKCENLGLTYSNNGFFFKRY